jgi:hypothetical protein
MKDLVLPLLLATSLTIGAMSLQGVERPDPHRGAGGEGGQASTPVDAGSPGCDLVIDYYRDLNRALFRADDFFDFLADESADFEDLTAQDAERILESGGALIADLQDLQVPGAYAEGNEGIIALMQFNLDILSFYALDSSNVPNVNAFDDAMLQIYEGEIALVDACPDEVDEIGGYVMYDPAELEQDLGLD